MRRAGTTYDHKARPIEQTIFAFPSSYRSTRTRVARSAFILRAKCAVCLKRIEETPKGWRHRRVV